MKKPKRRLIRVIYRYRIVSKSVRQKNASSNRKDMTSKDQSKDQNRPFENKATNKQSSALASFDSVCNPYQQFVDNLSFSLTNLPTEVFIGAARTTETLAKAEERQGVTMEKKTAEATGISQDLFESSRKTKNTLPHQDAIEPKTKKLPISPNLRYLPGIPNCFLASKPIYSPKDDKEVEANS